MNAAIGGHGSASQSITTKECLRSARYAAAGRAFPVSARHTFNHCLSLLKKFHTTYGTPSRTLGTQHIFFRAGIGCFSMDCGPFESPGARQAALLILAHFRHGMQAARPMHPQHSKYKLTTSAMTAMIANMRSFCTCVKHEDDLF